MQIIRFVPMFAAFLLFPATAHANWQWTQWGMTGEEVRAAAPTKVVPTTPEERSANSMSDGSQIALLSGRYSAGDFKFIVYFLFNDNGLKCVSLKLADPSKSPALLSALIAKYGEGKDLTDQYMIGRRWTADDQVTYIQLGDSLTNVRYCSRDASGL